MLSLHEEIANGFESIRDLQQIEKWREQDDEKRKAAGL